MIHFFYLIGFALFVSVVFGAMAVGSSKERIIYGLKIFAQFLAVSLILGWVLRFIPW